MIRSFLPFVSTPTKNAPLWTMPCRGIKNLLREDIRRVPDTYPIMRIPCRLRIPTGKAANKILRNVEWIPSCVRGQGRSDVNIMIARRRLESVESRKYHFKTGTKFLLLIYNGSKLVEAALVKMLQYREQNKTFLPYTMWFMRTNDYGNKEFELVEQSWQYIDPIYHEGMTPVTEEELDWMPPLLEDIEYEDLQLEDKKRNLEIKKYKRETMQEEEAAEAAAVEAATLAMPGQAPVIKTDPETGEQITVIPTAAAAPGAKPADKDKKASGGHKRKLKGGKR